MKKILIPSDFSESAWASLIYAVKLFEKVDCTFYILHTTILNSTSMTGLSTDKLNAEKEKSNVELDNLKLEAEKINLNPNHKFKTVLSFYHLDEAINFTVEKQDIDFTVIGTKGVTNAKDYLLGSNTTRVLKNIKMCPTILVPGNFSYKTIEQVVILSDLVHNMDEDLLTPVKKLLALNNSKTSILHISKDNKLTTEQEKELNSIKSSLTPFETSYHSYSKDNTSKDKIVTKFTEEVSADLLVLTYYKDTFFSKLLNKQSLTTTISQNPTIPMLILPNKNNT